MMSVGSMISGTGRSSTRTSSWPWKTTAFMVRSTMAFIRLCSLRDDLICGMLDDCEAKGRTKSYCIYFSSHLCSPALEVEESRIRGSRPDWASLAEPTSTDNNIYRALSTQKTIYATVFYNERSPAATNQDRLAQSKDWIPAIGHFPLRTFSKYQCHYTYYSPLALGQYTCTIIKSLIPCGSTTQDRP